MPPPHPYYPQHYGHAARSNANGGSGSGKAHPKGEEKNMEFGMGSAASTGGGSGVPDSPTQAGSPEKADRESTG